MKLTVEEVKRAISNAGLNPREYSGRYMYGKSCLGVDVSRGMVGEAVEMAVNLIHNGADPRDVMEWGRGTASDNMGMDMVLYWPSLELTAEEAAELGGWDEEGNEE